MIVEGGGRLIVEGGPLIRKRRHSYTSKRALHREQNSPAAVTLRGMKSLSDAGDGLLVVVMPVASEYKDKNLVFENAIHQSVLLRDFAAPAVFGLTLQRLGVTKSCFGMLLQLLDEAYSLGKSFWLVFLQSCKSLASLGCEVNIVHQSPLLLSISDTVSPGCSRTHLPCLYSSSPRSRLAMNSFLETSVGSFFFCAASCLIYFTSLVISLSSSAISPIARNSSAFICTAVIIVTCMVSGCKGTQNIRNLKISTNNQQLFNSNRI